MPKKLINKFYLIFFSLFGIINFYIFIHGFLALPSSCRLLYAVLYWMLASSFPLGRYLEKKKITVFSNMLVWIGSFWFAAMLYFFLACVIMDALLLVNLFIPVLDNIQGLTLFIISVISVSIIILAGFINARVPRTKNLKIGAAKETLKAKSYKIVSVSDIHLGTIIGRKRLSRLVAKINSLNPDIVLFPGDVVDEDITPVLRQNLGEVLKQIKARLGVYSVTGNHEYIGGAEKAVKYLEEHGVRVLRDESVFIDNAFYIIGREDISARGFAGKQRKPLEELVNEVDFKYPAILLDHQPYNLEQAVNNNIDLQLSGHTHHGQLWPLNFITKRIYEVSWGYKKIKNTHIYVSCGAGTWGPPVRTGNTPEIMVIELVYAGE